MAVPDGIHPALWHQLPPEEQDRLVRPALQMSVPAPSGNGYGVYGAGGTYPEAPAATVPAPVEGLISPEIWNKLDVLWQRRFLQQLTPPPPPPSFDDPPPAALYSGDTGNFEPGLAWINVDANGNLYVYGRLVAPATALPLVPSGDTTGATDVTTINNALGTGNVTVSLGSGNWYIKSPIVMPPHSALTGVASTSQVSQTTSGTVINITSGFTGKVITDGGPVTLNGAILLLGQTYGGFAASSEEQHIRDIMINGTSAPAGVSGILSYGAAGRVQLERVLISQVTGDGIQHNLDVAGNQPDAWNGFKVFSRFNTGKGYNLHSADSTWVNCLSSNNGDTGVDWFINTTSNSKYIGCRSEHAAGIGFGYVCTNSANSSGGVAFVGCSTDQAALHGMQIGGTINSIASNAHAVPILLSGCIFRRDGQNGGSGGTFAGLYVHGYGVTTGGNVTIAGCQTWPGVNDNGSGALTPQYGLWVDGGSLVNASGSSFCAATGGTAINNDASGGANSLYLDSVTSGTGATASLAVAAGPTLIPSMATPSTPSGGGYLYVSSGALHYLSPGNKDTILATNT